MNEKTLSLSFKNLFGYLEASPTSRCIIEGEDIVNARYIVTRDILEKTATSITMYAFCLKTTALTEKPHEIKIRMSTVNELRVSEAVCSCKTGNSGRCKHIAAILILCTRDNILRLPRISSADLECYWKESAAVDMSKAIPLREMLHSNAKSKVKPVINIDHDKILKMFTDALPDSALAKHIIGRRSQTQPDPKVLMDMDGNKMSL